METKKGIRRDTSLQQLSRDHHHSLLLCWKIRTGLSKGIETGRIKRYANWFYENHIESHFREEERYLFPILGQQHHLIKKAIGEHRRLTRLFNDQQDVERSLNRIEEALDGHIRFEERVLFTEIQEVASEEQLARIASLQTEDNFDDKTEDEFWR